MKNLILTLALMLSILCSCSKNEDFKTESNSDKIASVLTETNVNTQRIMYNMLTGDEKLEIWTDKINHMITKDNLNVNQSNLLRELLENLNPTIFDTTIQNNDEREIFMNVYSKNFTTQARLIFNDQYLYDNLFSLRAIEYLDADEIGTGSVDCACKKGAIFTCGTISSYTCKSGECRVLPDGCAFLGMSECNGICK